MTLARNEIPKPGSKRTIRGILVHGGSRKVEAAVMKFSAATPTIELIRYAVDVDFASST